MNPTNEQELRGQISNLMVDLMVEAKLIGLSHRQNMLKQGYCYISAHNGRLNEIMVLIQLFTNAEIAKVLDRLESQAESVTERIDSPLYVGDTRVDYRTHKMISPRAIRAERAKSKESL